MTYAFVRSQFSGFAVFFALTSMCLLPDASRGADIAAGKPPMMQITFLAGTWEGVGKSDSGPIRGTSTFTYKLGSKVLEREDHSMFGGQSTPSYDQLMVISADPVDTTKLDASYWDSAGHIIYYTADVPATGSRKIVFTSKPSAGPQFRLTYEATNKGLHTRFEVKSPGNSSYQIIADGDEKAFKK